MGALPALSPFGGRAGNRAIRLYLLPPSAPKGYRFYPLRGKNKNRRKRMEARIPMKIRQNYAKRKKPRRTRSFTEDTQRKAHGSVLSN
jgi:hypothetical protein